METLPFFPVSKAWKISIVFFFSIFEFNDFKTSEKSDKLKDLIKFILIYYFSSLFFYFFINSYISFVDEIPYFLNISTILVVPLFGNLTGFFTFYSAFFFYISFLNSSLCVLFKIILWRLFSYFRFQTLDSRFWNKIILN